MEEVRKVSFCPHCGNRAPQRLVYIQDYIESQDQEDEDGLPGTYYVAVCETCREILLYHAYIFEDVEDKNFNKAGLVYPDSGILHPSVPENIAKCYRESARIKQLAPNAFATQIRRALELLCDDCGAKKGSLQKRLQDLVSKGIIPIFLAKMTDVLRLLGNIGAHGGKQDIKPSFVYSIDEFFRAIIEYVYIAPSKLKDFEKSLETLKISVDKK